MTKLKDIEEINDTLKDANAYDKAVWNIEYPIEPEKLEEVKNALFGFTSWAKENGVRFKTKTNRKIILKEFRFDFSIKVTFSGTLKNIGLVLINYIDILKSINIISNDEEPHLHSTNSDEHVVMFFPDNKKYDSENEED